jgi:hypothetical protein
MLDVILAICCAGCDLCKVTFFVGVWDAALEPVSVAFL